MRVDRGAARSPPRAGDGHQRLDGGGVAPLSPLRRIRGPGGGGAAHLRPHPAAAEAGRRRVPAGAAGGGRDRRNRGRGRLAARGSETRSRDPQLPQPRRLHALGREAAAPGRARRRARLRPLRGRSLPADQLRWRGRQDDAGDGRGRPGDPRLVVLEDGQPRGPGRLPRRSRGGDRGPVEASERELHLTEHARRVGGLGALPLRGARAKRRIGQLRPAGAPRRPGRRPSGTDPGGEVRRARGRLLPLARSRRRRRHHEAACRGEGGGSHLRRGPRFHARGGRLQPPPLVRAGSGGSDPRGDRAAGAGTRAGARGQPRAS